MDNHEKDSGVNGVQVEPYSSRSDVENGSVSEKGIKPRLEERHIQMIAIAGVIVCFFLPVLVEAEGRELPNVMTNMSSGDRFIRWFWSCNIKSRPCRCLAWIYSHGLGHNMCRVDFRRNVHFHARHWRFHTTRFSNDRASTRCGYRMELL